MRIRKAEEADLPILLALFKTAYAELDHVPQSEHADFEETINIAFDENQIYRVRFFVMENEAGQIVSFAGLSASQFLGNSWELRWGTTHPDYQRQGCMTQLTKYRIQYARDENTKQNDDMPGLIQIASRQPTLYKKLGFKPVFERNIDNYALYMIKEV